MKTAIFRMRWWRRTRSHSGRSAFTGLIFALMNRRLMQCAYPFLVCHFGECHRQLCANGLQRRRRRWTRRRRRRYKLIMRKLKTFLCTIITKRALSIWCLESRQKINYVWPIKWGEKKGNESVAYCFTLADLVACAIQGDWVSMRSRELLLEPSTEACHA